MEIIEKELIGSWKLFRMLFWGYLFASFPFVILFSILTLTNIIPFNFNGVPYYGWRGLIGVIITTSICFSIPFAVMGWMLLSYGWFFYNKTLKWLNNKPEEVKEEI